MPSVGCQRCSLRRDSISQGIKNAAFTGDLDTLTSSTVCYCGNASTNTPTGKGGGLVVMSAAVAIVQLFALNDSPGHLYIRRFYNGAWLAWQQLA